MSMCYGDVIQIDPQLLALSATQTILKMFSDLNCVATV